MKAASLTRSLFDAILPARRRPPDPPPDEPGRCATPRREAALSAEIVTGGRSYAGQIRNISTSGLTLAFDASPTLFKGAQLLVRAGTLAPFTGTVRWLAGHECGMAFNSALAEELVEDTSALFDPGKRVRPDRARIRLTAMIRGPCLDRTVTIENICAGGVQLATDLSLVPGTGVLIDIDGILPIGGYVRWSNDGQCGVMFKSCCRSRQAKRSRGAAPSIPLG